LINFERDFPHIGQQGRMLKTQSGKCGKEDGLVSVLRLYLEPLSPQRSSQPANLGYEAAREQTIAQAAHFGSTGVLAQSVAGSPGASRIVQFFTVTDMSATGGRRNVTSVLLPRWIEMRLVHLENMPCE